jgi:hypothetical protein
MTLTRVSLIAAGAALVALLGEAVRLLRISPDAHAVR